MPKARFVIRRLWVRVPRGPLHYFPLSDAVSWPLHHRDRQRCPALWRGCGTRESSRSATESRSSANKPALTSSVIAAEACPNICCTTFTFAPDWIAREAAVCRSRAASGPQVLLSYMPGRTLVGKRDEGCGDLLTGPTGERTAEWCRRGGSHQLNRWPVDHGRGHSGGGSVLGRTGSSPAVRS